MKRIYYPLIPLFSQSLVPFPIKPYTTSMNINEDKKGENVEKWLTTSLLAAFLLNIKKVLIPDVLVEDGLFNEYLDISVYLFDGVFLLWLGYILLKHNNIVLSIYRKMFQRAYRQAGVEKGIQSLLFLITGLILWYWFSVFQADQIPLAIRSALTMTEIGIFVLIQLILVFHVEQSVENKSVPRGTNDNLYRSLIIMMTYFALFNSIIVFIQISTQHSTGLYYLGESFLNVGNSGVATITIFGEKILRGYGLFTHPNLLAAFLGLTILSLLISHNVPRGTLLNIKLSNISNKMFHRAYRQAGVEHLVISVLLVALILTFSRTGILLTLLGSICIVPRGTFLKKSTKESVKLFHVEQWLLALLIVVLLIIGGLSSAKSFSERELSLIEYSKLSHFQLIGSGAGSYGSQLYSKIESINKWSIQPIHNYFLLTYYELGVVGLFLIILLLIKLSVERVNYSERLFHVEQLEKNSHKVMFHVEHSKKYLALVFFLVMFSLGDHFFYTIPQGQAIFWLGLLIAIKERG